MKQLFLVVVLMLGTAFTACYAESFKRTNLTITNIHPIAAQRPAGTTGQNIIRIYVNSGDWGALNCRPTAADLQKTDSHLLSILLTAWTTGKIIDIEVDSTLKPWGDVCQITALSIRP